jgi:hypothetical protein
MDNEAEKSAGRDPSSRVPRMGFAITAIHRNLKAVGNVAGSF